jgi:hypothetical protein
MALVPVVALAVTLLLSFLAMRPIGLPATLMSWAACPSRSGWAVDADVVALEASHRRPKIRRAAHGPEAGGDARAVWLTMIGVDYQYCSIRDRGRSRGGSRATAGARRAVGKPID